MEIENIKTEIQRASMRKREINGSLRCNEEEKEERDIER